MAVNVEAVQDAPLLPGDLDAAPAPLARKGDRDAPRGNEPRIDRSQFSSRIWTVISVALMRLVMRRNRRAVSSLTQCGVQQVSQPDACTLEPIADEWDVQFQICRVHNDHFLVLALGEDLVTR